MGKVFAEMTQQEKTHAFETWVTGKETRGVKNKIKKQAIKALVDAHTDEFNTLLKKLGGTPIKAK